MEPFPLDGRVMNENVLLTLARDKAIALAVAEPFDSSDLSVGHVNYSFMDSIWGEAVVTE
jgi:hypothetical protein